MFSPGCGAAGAAAARVRAGWRSVADGRRRPKGKPPRQAAERQAQQQHERDAGWRSQAGGSSPAKGKPLLGQVPHHGVDQAGGGDGRGPVPDRAQVVLGHRRRRRRSGRSRRGGARRLRTGSSRRVRRWLIPTTFRSPTSTSPGPRPAKQMVRPHGPGTSGPVDDGRCVTEVGQRLRHDLTQPVERSAQVVIPEAIAAGQHQLEPGQPSRLDPDRPSPAAPAVHPHGHRAPQRAEVASCPGPAPDRSAYTPAAGGPTSRCSGSSDGDQQLRDGSPDRPNGPGRFGQEVRPIGPGTAPSAPAPETTPPPAPSSVDPVPGARPAAAWWSRRADGRASGSCTADRRPPRCARSGYRPDCEVRRDRCSRRDGCSTGIGDRPEGTRPGASAEPGVGTEPARSTGAARPRARRS